MAMASPLRLHPWLSGRPTTLQTGATATAAPATATPVAATATPVAGTATPSPSPTAGASPTPVATGTVTATPTFPDPVTLLQNTVAVYQKIRTAHFELVTNGNQPGTEKLHLDAKGDVSCKGPTLKGHVSAKDTIETTSKVSTLSVNFIIVKNTAYQRSKSTKNKWRKTSAAAFTQLGISADNLLLCPSSQSGSSSGSSGGNSQFKDLVNLGPATFQGHAVWHIRATETSTGSSGQPANGTFDLLLDQSRYFPYESTYSQTDQGVSLMQKQVLTKFGEKLSISAPRVATKTSHKKTTRKTTTRKKTTKTKSSSKAKKTSHKKKP